MARHRRSRGRSGFGGGKKILGLGTRGLVGSFGILGVAAAALLSNQIASAIPINVPYKDYAVSYAIAGPAGVVGHLAADTLMGKSGGSSGGVILY